MLLARLFASGHAVDLVLAVIVIEAFVLARLGRWPALAVALRLGPAVFMLLALRAALVGMDWRWIAVMLGLAFPLNLADLARGPGGGRDVE